MADALLLETSDKLLLEDGASLLLLDAPVIDDPIPHYAAGQLSPILAT